MAVAISWVTEKRVVNDLLPLKINPRKIDSKGRDRLLKSIGKFDLAEIPTVNRDNTIISGHQRVAILQELGRGLEEIDVRVPNRLLSQKELKEYNLISNTHAGVWDFDMIELEFADIEFEVIGIEMPQLYKSVEEEKFDSTIGKDIKPKTTSHALLTFPADSLEDVKEVLSKMSHIGELTIDYSK